MTCTFLTVLSFYGLFILFMTFTVPGGIAPESLTLTPLDDMIFLKWEEPVEPNGLITQYEVKEAELFYLPLFYLNLDVQ